MPTENLLLTIPETLSEAALQERLAASGYHVTPGGRETLAIIYADTQGGALHRAGVRLRHVRPRPRWQWWKGGEILHEEPGTPEQAPLPPAGKIAGGGTVAPARLLPLVRIEIQKRNFRVTAPSGGPVRLSVLQLRCARPHRPDWAPGPRLVQIPPAGTASRPVEPLRAVLCHWVGLSSIPPDLLEIALESLGLPLPGAPVPRAPSLRGGRREVRGLRAVPPRLPGELHRRRAARAACDRPGALHALRGLLRGLQVRRHRAGLSRAPSEKVRHVARTDRNRPDHR